MLNHWLNRLYVQQLFKVFNQGVIKSPHYQPFAQGNLPVTGGFPSHRASNFMASSRKTPVNVPIYCALSIVLHVLIPFNIFCRNHKGVKGVEHTKLWIYTPPPFLTLPVSAPYIQGTRICSSLCLQVLHHLNVLSQNNGLRLAVGSPKSYI